MGTDFLEQNPEERLKQFNEEIAEEGILFYAPENIKAYAGVLDDAFNKLTKAWEKLTKGLDIEELAKPDNINIGVENFQYSMLMTAIVMFDQEKSIPYETLHTYIQSLANKYMPKVDDTAFKKALVDLSERQDEIKDWDAQRIALWMLQTINGQPDSVVKYKYENLFQKCYALLLIISAQGLNLRICKQCGKSFITKDPRIRYCGQECKLKKKKQIMRLKRSGIYGEIEAIRNIWRNREKWGYGQDKAITKEEYDEFEQKLLNKLEKGKMSEEECLQKFEEMHEKIKSSP